MENQHNASEINEKIKKIINILHDNDEIMLKTQRNYEIAEKSQRK